MFVKFAAGEERYAPGLQVIRRNVVGRSGRPFPDWWNVAIAAGMLGIHEGVALLAGASTVPAARRQGAQSALLAARLRYAAEHGCDLAMMGALPGSASQRSDSAKPSNANFDAQ